MLRAKEKSHYSGVRTFCHKYIISPPLQLPTGSNMSSEVGPFRTETGVDCRDGEVSQQVKANVHRLIINE